jgi:hypothetical protein
MIPYENFYADVESALKGFTAFRRSNPETLYDITEDI